MASLRSAVAGVARRTAVGRRAQERRREDAARRTAEAQARELVEAGVVDLEWCSVLTGRAFATPTEAAVDYLRTGRKAGRSVHPLLEPAFVDAERWRTKNVDPALDYVRAGHARAPHPLFDETAYREAHPGCERGPGSSLGHFLRSADATTPLPAPAGIPLADPTYAEWRARVVDAARRHRERESLTGPRASDGYDVAAHERLVAAGAAAPVVRRGAEPVVSVVMPVRNRPVLVRDAIASLQAQTLRDWQLLVVDDGSTDETPDVLASLAADDDRITVVRGERRGVSAARNTGMAGATGEYVAFLDSDNVWRPWYLATVVTAMRERGSRLAYSGLEVRRPDKVVHLVYDGGLEHLRVANHVDLNVLVVERGLLAEVGGFDESLRRWVDHDLVLRLAEHEEPTFLPFVGAVIDESDERDDRITRTESDAWQYVVLQGGLFRWEQLEAGLPERVPGRVSVLIPTYQDWSMTVDAVRAVLETTEGLDVEVVVVDNGSGRTVATMLAGLLEGLPGVTIVSRPRNLNFAVGSNLAFARSTGELALFLNNDTVVRDGWLPPLVEALADPDVAGAQPLLLYADGTVQCAGVWFPGGDALPSHFLAHHPAEDARAMGAIHVRAVTGAATLLRAEDVVRARGFDPLFVNGWEDVDLCLRLGEGRDAPAFRVVTSSTVEHLESKTPGRSKKVVENRTLFLARWGGRMPVGDAPLWRGAGLVLGGTDTSHDEERGPLAVPRPVVVRPRSRTEDGVPRLRWAIKNPAFSGRKGDRWGDTFFADDLAAALRRLGQEVVVDRRDAYLRRTSHLDDVTLTLRGRVGWTPAPGRVNLLWVISHPEDVTVEEVRAFDSAFAASQPWSARMAQEAGVPVEVMHQATDPARFSPDLRRPDGAGVVFVGNSRGVDRRVLRDAADAGLDVAVWGKGWEGRLPDGWLRGDHLPNADLGSTYASADVVLCDHWPDMAAEGFLANRLFDAAASGTRVVTDPVPGIAEVFGPLVQAYDGPDDLRRLVADRATAFPPDEERAELGRALGARHSFDARARRLLDVALDLHARYRAED